MLTLDTNILIYYAAGDKRISDFLIQNLAENTPLFLPTVVVLEFFSFPGLASREQALFKTILPQLHIVVFDFDLSLAAADLRKTYRMKLGDSVVAATAIDNNSTLVTRNVRDFKKVSDLKLLDL